MNLACTLPPTQQPPALTHLSDITELTLLSTSLPEFIELYEFAHLGFGWRGLQVSGAKFYYLRNEAALLEMALVNWAMQKVVRRGFTPLMTPDIVREAVFEKCGFQPRGANTQVGGHRGEVRAGK